MPRNQATFIQGSKYGCLCPSLGGKIQKIKKRSAWFLFFSFATEDILQKRSNSQVSFFFPVAMLETESTEQLIVQHICARRFCLR